jgi:hypothetical protein
MTCYQLSQSFSANRSASVTGIDHLKFYPLQPSIALPQQRPILGEQALQTGSAIVGQQITHEAQPLFDDQTARSQGVPWSVHHPRFKAEIAQVVPIL